MSVDLTPTEAEILPLPTAELVLLRVLAQAYLATVSRRRAEAFLRRASELLADEASVAALFPIRPREGVTALNKARREAVGVFRVLLPAFVAAVPRE